MSNCVFGSPIFNDSNLTYTPSYSGGTWSSTLTLANLSDRKLSKVARSSAVTLASTQFEVDLKTSRGVQLIAIPKHSLTLAAKIRARGSTVAGVFTSPVYDSGWIDVFPIIYPVGILPVGHPSYSSRKLSQEDLTQGYNIGFVHFITTPQEARYWLIEVDDTTNPAGYVDLARLVISAAWQPTANMSFGAQLGYETESTKTITDGGAAVYDTRARRRRCVFTIDDAPENEMLVRALDIQRDHGTTKQLFFIFDPADTEHLHRRSFLGVLNELGPLQIPYYGVNTAGWSIVEEL